MVRSPMSARQDEAPLTPPEEKPASTLHQAQQESFSLNKISFGGQRHSEIPQNDIDYYPTDTADRTLFRETNCDFCDCDCDCTSDGFIGCLRRNRQCLFTVTILSVTTFVILLIFRSLSYEHKGRYVEDIEEVNTWESHHHHYNESDDPTDIFESEDYSNKRASIPVIVDPREPDYYIFLQDEKQISNSRHEEVVKFFKKRNKRSFEPTKVRTAIIGRKSQYEDVLAELNEIEKSMMGYRKHLPIKDHTVFEPFSLTNPTTVTWTEGISSEENYIEDVDEMEDLRSTIGMDSITEGIGDTTASEEGFTIRFSELESGRTDAVYTDNWIESDTTTDHPTGPDGEGATETTPPKLFDPITSVKANQESTTSTAGITYHASDGKESGKAKNSYLTDGFSGDLDDFSESYPEAMPEQKSTDNTIGISLEDAKKKKLEGRKHLLLNSRIVHGMNDVVFPTAPDVTKPELMGTVETLKTNQQLSITPSAFAQYFFPYQMCFYSQPPPQDKSTPDHMSPKTLKIEPPSFFKFPHHFEDSEKKASYHFPTQQNFLSFNINNYANQGHSATHFPPSAGPVYTFPSPQNFAPFLGGSSRGGPVQQQQQPLFCTYIHPPLMQFPTVISASEVIHPKCADCEEEPIASREVTIFSGKDLNCLDNTVSCRDGTTCVPIINWCDNKINCKDGSDEIYCSCRERLTPDRLCDGYLDCPDGEDEAGCFGCPKSTFSCDTFDEPRACIPLSKRCDNVRDCPTGKDEMDCNALFPDIRGNESHHISFSKGFLHRNWRGDWYPVCVEINSNLWANSACIGELGTFSGEPEVSFAQVSAHYKGPFIVRGQDNRFTIQDHCKGHVATYVSCPEMQCGTRIISEGYAQTRFGRFAQSERSKFDEWWKRTKKDIMSKYNVADVYWKLSPVNGEGKTEDETKKIKREETGRVVGGKESEPRAWPWVVALYKNGDFHCGGVILDDRWIMTAAHCVEHYHKTYLEIRSGMLRRFSYSPMEQVRSITDVVIHEKYNKTIMNNDISLLRMSRPLVFNRWVRPACLPSFDGDFWGPVPGTRCIAIGWGAVKEHGSNPDQMREVEVPILSKCRHVEDLQGNEICAGIAEGGKDTCQGDSGGPLLCRDSKTHWYVAGIVSHGEGCARPGEPGAYTRVSLLMDWITANANDFQLPPTKPLTKCPGFRCTSGSRRCISPKWVCNGLTDCLHGEDELNCPVSERMTGRSDDDKEVPTKTLKKMNDTMFGEGSTKMEDNQVQTPVTRSLKKVTEVVTYLTKLVGERREGKKPTEDTTDSMVAAESVGVVQESDANGGEIKTPFPSELRKMTDTDKEVISGGASVAEERTIYEARLVSPSKEDQTVEDGVEMAIMHGKDLFERLQARSKEETITEPAGGDVFTTERVVENTAETLPTESGEKNIEGTTVGSIDEGRRFNENSMRGEVATEAQRRDQSVESGISKGEKMTTERGDDEETTTEGRMMTSDGVDTDVIKFTDEKVKVSAEGTRDDSVEYGKKGGLTATGIERVEQVEAQRESTSGIGLEEKNGDGEERESTERTVAAEDVTAVGHSTETAKIGVSREEVSEDQYVKQERLDRDKNDRANSAGYIRHYKLDVRSRHGKEQEIYQCRDIIQTVKGSNRCDGVIDCEDATDETLCTCRDHLLKTNPELLCDGHADCEDLTDEKYCHVCSRKEFNCRRSKECLPRFKRCDGTPDCSFGEDEENCYALTKSGKVSVNGNGKPLFRLEGKLMTRRGGVWSPYCLDDDGMKAAVMACSSIGSSGYDKYENGSDSTSSCRTLHVTCSRRLANDPDYYKPYGSHYHWPWHAIVYADGQERCFAALLESDWLITALQCVENLSFRRNHIVAKLGTSKANVPNEFGTQIIRVDDVKRIRDTDIVLLHLDKPANTTWYVRPITVPFWFDATSSKDLCVAVGEDNTLLRSLKDCSGSVRCYAKLDQSECCRGSRKVKPWTGVVACQSQFGWYPASVLHVERGFRSGEQYVSENILEKISDVKAAIGEEVSVAPEIRCNGLRCREGKCVERGEICDGTADCPDREDESEELCAGGRTIREGCGTHEMRCPNGECIPKKVFGNGIADCWDGSDEPESPMCFDYLKLTSPYRICDGVPNCFDKSDERPDMCACSESKFTCTRSVDTCIPVEYVCDGHKDCPDGEDEAACVGFKKLESPGFARDVEIIHMSYGVWHTLCSPSITGDEADAICQELGYETSVETYRKNQTRLTPILDAYTTVKLNPKTSILLRGDRPFVNVGEDGYCEAVVVRCQ